MAAFTDDPAEWERLDWRLLQNGPIAMYHKRNLLSEDVSWLRDHRYEVYEFNCEGWTSETIVHDEFKRSLNFPDYYGHNLDALHDSLSDISIPQNGGVALVLYRYDSYVAVGGLTAASRRSYAEVILDILAATSQVLLLTGRRFLVMIQSDDPRIRFGKLACISATWNPREWLDKNRGL
jgi:hypothetical protein